MKIGFDVSQTGAGRAGCGWYARAMVEHLESIDRDNEYVLYPTFGDFYWSTSGGRDTYQPSAENFSRGLHHNNLEAMQNFWRHPPADWRSKLGSPDIIHANNFFCPVRLEGVHLVYTLYDLAFGHHPDWSTEANRIGCFDGVFHASLYADFIVAISEYSRRDFLGMFPYFPSERIAAIPAASRFVRGNPSTEPRGAGDLRGGEFWLHVGTDEPRKNIDHLLAAYATIKKEGPRRMPLVLAGGDGWLAGDLAERVRTFGVAEDVLALGYVADDQLQWLYEKCFAFVFPSLFEGFGMPVLEAMELGAPVIASATTSIPEITGESALLIDPLQIESTVSAMRRLLREPETRDQMREAGIERARHFSWDRCARRLLGIYETAVDLGTRPR